MIGQNKNFDSVLGSTVGRTVLFAISTVAIIGASLIIKPTGSASPTTSYTSNPSATSSTTGSASTTSPSSTSSKTSSPPATAKNTVPTQTSSTGTLITPDRSTYASDHTPSAATQTEESICVTTPGAKCTIYFSLNNHVLALPTQTVGTNGAAYWTWTPRQYGLTSGNWTIAVKATLGTQTKTSTDSILLQIP